MGMRPGRFHASLAASTELGAGILFALGLVTPLAALAIVALMWVAGATVHWENGFMSAKDGIELNFIYAILAIGVATIGPGEYSLDHALDLIEDLDGVTGLLIAAIGGVGAALAQLAIFYQDVNICLMSNFYVMPQMTLISKIIPVMQLLLHKHLSI